MTTLELEPLADRTLDALCTWQGFPDDWYAHPGSLAGMAAKAVCAQCPLQPECVKRAAVEEFGIWGGVAAHGRRRHDGGSSAMVKAARRERGREWPSSPPRASVSARLPLLWALITGRSAGR